MKVMKLLQEYTHTHTHTHTQYKFNRRKKSS